MITRRQTFTQLAGGITFALAADRGGSTAPPALPARSKDAVATLGVVTAVDDPQRVGRIRVALHFQHATVAPPNLIGILEVVQGGLQRGVVADMMLRCLDLRIARPGDIVPVEEAVQPPAQALDRVPPVPHPVGVLLLRQGQGLDIHLAHDDGLLLDGERLVYLHELAVRQAQNAT